ncbi:MAG: hypothetical protein JO285_02875, partial [Kutzneria sp.]|nr:hypothetical protein [Kutzneria sp.]
MAGRNIACCQGDCCCGSSGLPRRGFLSLSAAAAGAAVLAAHSRDAFAAGVLPDRALAPADKGFSRDWINGLYERGTPTRYAGDDLRHIGMPVGGGGCGQVYLGGDGQLWYLDLDNGPPPPGTTGSGDNYAKPHTQFSPFGHGFVLRTTTTDGQTVRRVDGTGFADVAFTGQYPLGTVDYRAADCPVSVRLEAFSPFVPGEVEDSTLPLTVLAYTLTNTSAKPVTAELTGWAENPVCLRSRSAQPITLSSVVANGSGYRGVQFTAANGGSAIQRPDIVFENWEKADYAGWTVQGDAFGVGPVLVSEVPDYMLRFGDLHVRGQRFVTSHNFRATGGDATRADSYTGRLVSAPFTVQRRYLSALVGGGNQPNQACLNVIVDGTVVASMTGKDTEPLVPHAVDLTRYQGKTAHIEIVDTATGGWGHINVDDIVFTDLPAGSAPVDQLADGGTVALAVVAPDTGQVVVRPSLADWSTPAAI